MKTVIERLFSFLISIIFLGTAITPMVLTVAISPYWMLLYLVYLVIFIVSAVKFKHFKEKDVTPKK